MSWLKEITQQMVPVTGNTFPVKDQLKALGAKWNGMDKVCENYEYLTLSERCDALRDARDEAEAAAARAPLDKTTYLNPYDEDDPRHDAYGNAYRKHLRLRREQ